MKASTARRVASLIVLTIGIGLLVPLIAAPPAQALSCAVRDVPIVQSVDGNVFKVARVAGAHAGLPDQWEMKVDGWFCNPTASTFKVGTLKIEHLNNGSVVDTTTATATPSSGTNQVGAGKEKVLYFFRDHTQFDFPLPQQVRLTFAITDLSNNPLPSIVKTYSVAEHTNPGPLTGYFFPARQSDLPTGAYWTQTRHAELLTFQRYAYDLGVQRWTGSEWTALRSGFTDTEKRESYLVWDRPVYAMSDGEIIGCNRGGVDNDPAQKIGNVPGGNILWVRYGNETTLYAHLKQNTIPSSLCPFNDDAEHKLADPNTNAPGDAAYQIKAGTYLGQTGTSGSSRDYPHLHIHTFMGLPKIWGGSETGIDSDSRPMRFVNVQVQERASTNVDSSKWREMGTAATLPYDTRLRPNTCGFVPNATKGEVARLGVEAACFPQMYNATLYAGYRPVWFDVVEGNGTTYSSSIWRKNDGTGWLLLAGLDGAGLQSAHNQYVVGNGMRYLHLETYSQTGTQRYAIVLASQPGYTQHANWGMTAAQLQSYFNSETANGYRPVQIAAAEVAGTMRYTALMESRAVGSYAAKAEIAIGSYQAEFDSQAAAGRSLSYIDGHNTGGAARISGIWYGGLTGSYAAQHGLSKASMNASMASNLAAGRYTRAVTAYFEGGVLRFAAVWRPRPNTTITSGPGRGLAFTFSADDPLATFECAIDRGSYQPCTSPRSVSGLAAGTHTFRVRAVDRQRRTDSSPATQTFNAV